MSVKADLHVHSNYSPDSLITPKDLVYYAKKRGLNAVAITDHNRVEGAFKIAKEINFLIIPGTEVSSRHGHIVGLNVREVIPKGLSAEETIERIHDAGGIAIACHPFALLKGSVGKHVTEKFDAIEVINASAFPFKRNMIKAKEVAKRLKLPCVAGTDAHYGPQIGYASTLIDSEPNVEEIVKAILSGKCEPVGEAVPFGLKMIKQIRFYSKKTLKN
jgi:predicted metal-dependent phosphoesterase TrpH